MLDAARVAKDVVTASIEDRVASNAPFDTVRVGARR